MSSSRIPPASCPPDRPVRPRLLARRMVAAVVSTAILGGVARAWEPAVDAPAGPPAVDEAKPPAEPAAKRASDPLSKEKPPAVQKWIRILRNKKGKPLAMQTAVVRYEPAPHAKGVQPGVHVDLVGAVHVGDAGYYTALNRRFDKYDALLYELVAPKGTVVERGRGTSNAHPVGALQNGMKGLLGLEHQLEQIDYTRSNFIHADMSPDELARSMNNRGESFLQMYFRMLGAEMARQSRAQAKGESAEFDLLLAFFSSDRDRRLKIALAQQFENVETLMVGFNGPDGSTLITERNKVALAVLADELKKGRTRIGVFYGAGHLPDMDERLRNEFRLQPTTVTWLDAWNLRPGS